MPEEIEIHLDGEIWENEHWSSDYCLDIDVCEPSSTILYNLIESRGKTKIEIIIKIKNK